MMESSLIPYAVAAVLIELSILAMLAPRPTEPARPVDSHFIEAKLVTLPAPATSVPRPVREAAVSKRPASSTRVAAPVPPVADNVTKGKPAPPPVAKTHGPLALYNPAPVLPSYLTDHDINAAVVIEFQVNKAGEVTPRLIASSDNEELDALAISTAKTWRFAPAENVGEPVDSRVRLRIVFEVR